MAKRKLTDDDRIEAARQSLREDDGGVAKRYGVKPSTVAAWRSTYRRWLDGPATYQAGYPLPESSQMEIGSQIVDPHEDNGDTLSGRRYTSQCVICGNTVWSDKPIKNPARSRCGFCLYADPLPPALGTHARSDYDRLMKMADMEDVVSGNRAMLRDIANQLAEETAAGEPHWWDITCWGCDMSEHRSGVKDALTTASLHDLLPGDHYPHWELHVLPNNQTQSLKRGSEGESVAQNRPASTIPNIGPGGEPAPPPIHNQIANTAASDFAGFSLHSSVAMAAKKLGRDPGGSEASTVVAAALAADPEATMGTVDLLRSTSDGYICETHQEAHTHYAVYGPTRNAPDGNSLAGKPIGGVSSVYEDDECACGAKLLRVENGKGQWDRYECAETGKTLAGATDSSLNTCGAGLKFRS